jgi:ATP-dependent HslUV protease subunit HslV
MFALLNGLASRRFPSQLARACVELGRMAHRWHCAVRYAIVADKDETLLLTGAGDVLEPEHQVIAVGSGGNFAFAAARALYDYEEDPELIARKAMEIAAQICVYTNGNLTVEKLNG